jgi:hypothetical protein
LELSVTDVYSKQSHGGSSLGTTPALFQPFHVRNVKLDFPRFDGSDILHWIFKAIQFFDYYKIPKEQRFTIIVVHMDKEVIPGFQMMLKT